MGFPAVSFIYKSKFGGYYVGGDFRKWNGKPVQPIVRIMDVVTNVKEHGKLSERATVEVFPNPSNGIFTIFSDEQVMAFSIIDLLGKEIISQPSVIANSNESLIVNLSNYKKGIYLLRLMLEDGSFVSKKLVKN